MTIKKVENRAEDNQTESFANTIFVDHLCRGAIKKAEALANKDQMRV
jgi:hypothetical protein